MFKMSRADLRGTPRSVLPTLLSFFVAYIGEIPNADHRYAHKYVYFSRWTPFCAFLNMWVFARIMVTYLEGWSCNARTPSNVARAAGARARRDGAPTEPATAARSQTARRGAPGVGRRPLPCSTRCAPRTTLGADSVYS